MTTIDTSATLSADLSQFHGTQQWFRHPLNRRLLHTEGVQYFADQAHAHWFIDAIALGIGGEKGPVPDVVPGKDHFAVVLLESRGNAGWIELLSDYDENDDSVGDQLWFKTLDYTDCPEGIWKFYLVDDGEHTVLMLPGEY